ncbi:hypothetical protein SDC9_142672 [bioreactor metagenome]|uniref:Uncharacterized protein n=1 Tax=bioreactor metagenome TaxID=1076179 RepID=A0A645E1G9_9ZZZZ
MAGAGVVLLTEGTVFPDLTLSVLTLVLLKDDLSVALVSISYVVLVLVLIPDVIPEFLGFPDLTNVFPFVEPLEILPEGRSAITEPFWSLFPLIFEVTVFLDTAGL